MLAGLGAGGAERVVSLLAAAWAARGDRVTVIAFDHADDPVFHDFDANVALVRLGLPPGSAPAPLLALRRVGALRAALRGTAPQLVVSFLTKVNVVALAACLGLPVRLAISERNNPRLQQASPLWAGLLRALHPRADAIVMQTEASLALLAHGARARARVIGNPIAAPISRADATRARTLVAVGRLEEQKGFDLLIDAFDRAAMAHPDWTLTIWGEGPCRAALRAHVVALGLERRVALAGTSEVPGGWIAEADAFVLSSRYEGMPNALGEAMAAGLPCIAFACDFGPGEMIRSGVDGLLVPAGDVAALAAAIDRMLGDDGLRERLGQAARQAALRFAPARIVAQWDRLFADLLDAPVQ